MDALTYAVHLNDEGISQMLSGNEETASTFLRRSLRAFKQVGLTFLDDVNNNNTTMVGCKEEMYSSVEEDCSSYLHRTDFSHSLPSLEGVSKNYDDDDRNHFYLYSKPIVLTNMDALKSNPQLLNVSCACIVFNTALSYHSQAVRRGLQQYDQNSASDGTTISNNNNMTILLRKAQMLYDIVAKLLGELPPPLVGKNENATATLVRLAAANNSSHVLYLQGHHDRTMERLYLVSYLLQLSPGGDNRILYGGGYDVLEEKERHGFLRNTFLVLCHHPNLAPAA